MSTSTDILVALSTEGKGIVTVAFDDPGRAAVDIEPYQADGWKQYADWPHWT